MKLTELEDTYKQKGFFIGSTLLLKPHDALALIDDACAEGFRVYGVDGFFRIGERGIQPTQDHSHSYEYSAYGNNQPLFVAALKAFITARIGQDVWFEVIMLDERDSS